MAELKNLPHIKYDYEKPDYFSIDPMKPLIEEIIGEFRIQEENNIMKAVSDVGIVVDKPRLLQALTDAKAFYEEGYRAAMYREVRHERFEWGYRNGQYGIWCTNCGAGWTDSENAEWIAHEHDYCPKCGAKMDGKGEGE